MYLRKVTHLFGRTHALENQIDEFLDKVTEAGLVFEKAIATYLAEGANETYDSFLDQEQEIESREDVLRRSIESELFARTLIPDLRADVMTMLEDTDGIVNMFQANLFRISIQQPRIPVEFHGDFHDLVETVVKCVESVVSAARAFFRDMSSVRDHAARTIFLESEADKLSTRLQRSVFSSDLPLERMMHVRYFIERIDDIANEAEDLADVGCGFIGGNTNQSKPEPIWKNWKTSCRYFTRCLPC